MARLWQIAQVAKEYHVLPAVAARDLDEDPEQLSLVCLSLLNYGVGYNVYRAANKRQIEGFRKSPQGDRLMTLVQDIAFELTEEQMER